MAISLKHSTAVFDGQLQHCYFCLKSFESFTSYFCSTVVSHSNKSCRGSWVVGDSRLSFHLLISTRTVEGRSK